MKYELFNSRSCHVSAYPPVIPFFAGHSTRLIGRDTSFRELVGNALSADIDGGVTLAERGFYALKKRPASFPFTRLNGGEY